MAQAEQGFTVEAADHHRNGVGGAGFFVAIVNDEETGRMLVINFPDEHGTTAVLNLDEAHKGNIYMHPEPGKPGTGGNAWRGDRLGHKYNEAIEAEVQAGYDRLLADMNKTKEDINNG